MLANARCWLGSNVTGSNAFYSLLTFHLLTLNLFHHYKINVYFFLLPFSLICVWNLTQFQQNHGDARA